MVDVVVETLGPLFSLAEVKEHLKVESLDEDELIQAYMDAATLALLRYCNASIVPIGAEAVFKVAGFMTVADMYEPAGREGRGDGLPGAARRLVDPFRNLRV